MRIRLFLSLFVLLLPIMGCDRGTTPRLIGKPAPDFTLNDGTQTLQLSKYRGHTVVLNFWAYWCAPCGEEVPSMSAMQKELQGKVVLLAVCASSGNEPPCAPDPFRQFLSEYKVDFFAIRDDANRTNALFGTVMFPETYIIDSQGIVRRKFIGAVNWTKPEILDYLRRIG